MQKYDFFYYQQWKDNIFINIATAVTATAVALMSKFFYDTIFNHLFLYTMS